MTLTRIEEEKLLQDVNAIRNVVSDKVLIDSDSKYPYVKGELMGMLEQLYNLIQSPRK
tara:strand:+ start:283 stop:456 length:174 start_codon:yes stop_codon:yes gene_type:complete